MTCSIWILRIHSSIIEGNGLRGTWLGSQRPLETCSNNWSKKDEAVGTEDIKDICEEKKLIGLNEWLDLDGWRKFRNLGRLSAFWMRYPGWWCALSKKKDTGERVAQEDIVITTEIYSVLTHHLSCQTLRIILHQRWVLFYTWWVW